MYVNEQFLMGFKSFRYGNDVGNLINSDNLTIFHTIYFLTRYLELKCIFTISILQHLSDNNSLENIYDENLLTGI